MNIGFTGHRNRLVDEVMFDELHRRYPNAVWGHGGAKGFDTQVGTYAANHGISVILFLPDYDKFPPKIAPLRRNDALVKWADFVVAAYDGRESGGTYYTIQQTTKANKPLMIWHLNTE